MARIYHNWLFDGKLKLEVLLAMQKTLGNFKSIYEKLKDKKRTAVEKRIFMMAFHAYEKRAKSQERWLPSSIMALCQYEGYAKKLLKWNILETYGEKFIKAKRITKEEESMLNEIIQTVAEFRVKFHIPPFKILQPALDYNELDDTSNYIKENLLESEKGLSKEIDLDFELEELKKGELV